MSKVLVVVAHPDDEVLGCGATVAHHVNKGDDVYIVYMADGVSSRTFLGENNEIESDAIDERNLYAKKACQILGANPPFFFGFQDNKMDAVALLDIVKPLEAAFEKIRPSVVYTHYSGDLNVDHRVTYQAVMTICRPQPDFYVKKILCFEILSSTEWSLSSYALFRPNYFIGVSSCQMKKKLEALRAYSSEMRRPPHPRSFDNVESLAKLRGATIGVHRAEAFMAERIIK